MRHNLQSGFTLMETLIALVIMGVMAMGFIHFSKRQSDHLGYLVDKTVATTIAANIISNMQMSKQWLQNYEFSQTVNMANRKWQVEGHIQETASKDLRRLEVSVMIAKEGSTSDETKPLATLVGFVGKF